MRTAKAKQELESYTGIVYFSAPWCGPCEQVKDIIPDVDREFLNVDVDETPNIANEYSVRSLPTFIRFEDGEPQQIKTGLASKEELEDL